MRMGIASRPFPARLPYAYRSSGLTLGQAEEAAVARTATYELTGVHPCDVVAVGPRLTLAC